ncbi:MAG TPA: alternative ribosome rescue aminoacyl-tRNA hydrolase ArfB [Gammaproteobacteria bacterium]
MPTDSPQLPPIPDNALEWRAIRSPGPGGQNVNKVATAIQLRVHLAKTGLLPAVRARLEKLAGRRVSSEGVLLIEANRFRSQERNRADAWERFEALLARALIKPKRRIPTRVPGGERKQRMEDKRKRSTTKQLRGRGGVEE